MEKVIFDKEYLISNKNNYLLLKDIGSFSIRVINFLRMAL